MRLPVSRAEDWPVSDRDQLYLRLETRMERIFEAGLIDEVKAILERGYPAEAKPFESIGYKEALQVVQGALSPRDAVFYARRETRRYSSQMTWFRQEPGLEIFGGFGDDPAIAGRLLNPGWALFWRPLADNLTCGGLPVSYLFVSAGNRAAGFVWQSRRHGRRGPVLQRQ